MEFHAWIKQRLLKRWPDSVDASERKKKSIVKFLEDAQARRAAKVKGATLGLTFTQTEPVCSVVWRWTGKTEPRYQEMEGRESQDSFMLLLNLCSLALTSSYTLEHMCLFYAL